MNTISTNGYVSISEFSRGNTSRIFRELEHYTKITVLKNNKPVGILTLPNVSSNTNTNS